MMDDINKQVLALICPCPNPSLFERTSHQRTACLYRKEILVWQIQLLILDFHVKNQINKNNIFLSTRINTLIALQNNLLLLPNIRSCTVSISKGQQN